MVLQNLSRLAAVPVVQTPVVYAVEVAVTEDGLVRAGVALPGRIGLQDHLATGGLVQLELEVAGDLLDEVLVNEELESVADVGWSLGGCGHGYHPHE